MTRPAKVVSSVKGVLAGDVSAILTTKMESALKKRYGYFYFSIVLPSIFVFIIRS